MCINLVSMLRLVLIHFHSASLSFAHKKERVWNNMRAKCNKLFIFGWTVPLILEYVKVKVTWNTVKYGDPYSEFVLCIYPSKVHTHSSEHTPWTHTRSSGQPFMLRRSGSIWGLGALLKGTSVMVLRMEITGLLRMDHNLWITSPTL